MRRRAAVRSGCRGEDRGRREPGGRLRRSSGCSSRSTSSRRTTSAGWRATPRLRSWVVASPSERSKRASTCGSGVPEPARGRNPLCVFARNILSCANHGSPCSPCTRRRWISPARVTPGGMNVYIRAVAERLAEHEVEVDLFTRCRGADGPRDRRARRRRAARDPQGRPVRSGPEDRSAAVPAGVPGRGPAPGTGRRAGLRHRAQSLLALGMGRQVGEGILGLPLVASFHTLGKVKNYSLARGEAPEPPSRLVGEERGDRRGRPDPGADACGGGAARGAVPGRSRSTSGSCRPAWTTRSSSRATARAARDRLHLTGPPAGAVRRASPGAQGTRHRGADARGGGRAGPGAHAAT